ncbi:MAG: DUF2024 family protein [Chitinophagaceae bacterium]|nr:DUF2024 family protein [Chitinophagaceae bacterium]MCW5904790.1 DUF2024 family protein [Chitinophagaceae bacterium]
MQVAIWDTYVTKKDGTIMHFDIIAPSSIKNTSIILQYGNEYLQLKGQSGKTLTTKECVFCHIETLRTEWENDINTKGYYIYEMENCN